MFIQNFRCIAIFILVNLIVTVHGQEELTCVCNNGTPHPKGSVECSVRNGKMCAFCKVGYEKTETTITKKAVDHSDILVDQQIATHECLCPKCFLVTQTIEGHECVNDQFVEGDNVCLKSLQALNLEPQVGNTITMLDDTRSYPYGCFYQSRYENEPTINKAKSRYECCDTNVCVCSQDCPGGTYGSYGAKDCIDVSFFIFWFLLIL